MMKPAFSYREMAPTAKFEAYVLSFWEFVVESEFAGSIDYEIFPDGCTSLFYYRNRTRNINVVGLSSLSLETVTQQVYGGDQFWGMRISPAACSDLLRIDPIKLLRFDASKSEIDLSHLTAGLIDDLTSVPKFEEFVSICELRISGLIADGCSYDLAVAEAVRQMAELKGESRMPHLAQSVGLSVRHLQRRFKASSGLTPKQFLRARRIRAAAVNIVENRDQNWASRAAELGFSDQSHLTHEFIAITNRSPRAFAENLRDVAHGELIK